jgi:DNA-binding SARP family transcriptional activator
LGAFRVTCGERVVPDDAWRRRKPAGLLKLLAMAPGHRMHREQLMDLLWPELDPAAAGANLRKAAHHARAALDDAAAGGGEMIVTAGEVLAIDANDLVVDTEQFRALLTTARRATELDAYRQAIDAYRGELLPDDRYDEWAVSARRELHLEFLAGLTEMAALLEARGEVEAAIATVRRLVAEEPTDEEGHAGLMRLYALAGRRADALRQYEHLCRTLDEELGTEPGPAAQRLYEEIRARQADEPELSAELWERVGDLRAVSGDHAGAAKAFELALGAHTESAAAARIERKCAEAWLMQHRPDVAAPHIQAADALARDPAERARLLRAHAHLGWESGDIPQAQHYAEQAREAAREHGNADDVAAAYEAIAIVAHFKGEWREGVASELERLASDESGATQLARVFDIHHCIGQYHLYGDGLAGSVEEYARRILDRAVDASATRAQAFAWCLLGESLLLQSRWDEADGCLERSCALHETLDSRSGALPWQRRAELAVCLGSYDDAEDYLRTASGIATVSVMASHLWGRIYAVRALSAVDQGDPERAVRAVQAAAAAAARYGDCPTCSALLNPIAAEAFALIGAPEQAGSYADAAGGVASMFNSSAWQAMAETAHGSAAAAVGDTTAASRHFLAASEGYGRAGQPYWADRSTRQAALLTASPAASTGPRPGNGQGTPPP